MDLWCTDARYLNGCSLWLQLELGYRFVFCVSRDNTYILREMCRSVAHKAYAFPRIQRLLESGKPFYRQEEEALRDRWLARAAVPIDDSPGSEMAIPRDAALPKDFSKGLPKDMQEWGEMLTAISANWEQSDASYGWDITYGSELLCPPVSKVVVEHKRPDRAEPKLYTQVIKGECVACLCPPREDDVVLTRPPLGAWLCRPCVLSRANTGGSGLHRSQPTSAVPP